MSATVFLIGAVLCIGAVALVLRLFRPRPAPPVDQSDPWAQHNELRMPSLEEAPQAGDTEVDAAVAVQDLGIH